MGHSSRASSIEGKRRELLVLDDELVREDDGRLLLVEANDMPRRASRKGIMVRVLRVCGPGQLVGI